MGYSWRVPKFKITGGGKQKEFSDSLTEALKEAVDSNNECQFYQNPYVRLVISMRDTTASYFSKNPHNQKLKHVIKEYVAKTWGGVPSVDITKLKEDPEDFKKPNSGISACQTKIFAAKNPSEYFVLDSSVSWALNEIALCFSDELANNSISFPILKGKGDIKFTEAEGLTDSNQRKNKKIGYTLKKTTYLQYCDLLKKVAKRLEAEMHLDEKLEPQLLEIALFVFGRYLRYRAKLFAKEK